MKKLLITGFEPFGGQKINPSWEAVTRLPDIIGDFTLIRRQIPVEYGTAGLRVKAEAAALSADAVLMVGQAGGRTDVCCEVVGVNIRNGKIPDNAGYLARLEPIEADGPAAFFSTLLPDKAFIQRLRNRGLHVDFSCSAGSFICNEVLYSMLRAAEGTDMKVGFIHVPFLPEQAAPGVPCLSMEEMLQILEAVIGQLSQ